jgi:MoxR-like ATPase
MKFTRPYFDPPDDGPYVFTQDITLAVNAAIATGRVLLVEGLPGNGKSSLANAVAQVLQWRFYERVITSRTAARDLLWEFDALQRLADAQQKGAVRHPSAYVQPQVLWWAFEPTSASRRGAPYGMPVEDAGDPASTLAPDAVVLLDEIDKADPDMPNDLLVPLGENRFEIRESNTIIQRDVGRRVLIIVTSNGERTLAPAFVRRCIRLELEPRNESDLIQIAERHFGKTHAELFKLIAQWCIEERARPRPANRRPPSTAEFLDIVTACGALETGTQGTAWERLTALLGTKPVPAALT